ncbi:hypothetical protein GCM10011608_02490 [Micromonospora sonchi]|uniref:DUF6884 domain-containing protein n=1 Tax=Micromonospora sonchi TaxID=1763543 RepID=A0A917WQH4_9ACTN|nr:DUF6884 domain-containing protein [Micromonospora sonchi]GGM21330.1 hypothetical protein GCM10011608_02490 [Micromonospora sonchi]
MKILVITSCTGDKATSSSVALKFDDFNDPARVARREVELAQYLRPAGEMYTGQQHVRAMAGVRRLRKVLGDDGVQVSILSAGYGLIREDRPIAPYDVTFNSMGRPKARSWAEQLGVPDAARRFAHGHDLVFVLLGSAYLDALAPPLDVGPGQRVVFFAPSKERSRVGRATLVPAGLEECARFGAGLIALKGRMLELLGRAVSMEGFPLLEEILADDSPKTIFDAMDRAVGTR